MSTNPNSENCEKEQNDKKVPLKELRNTFYECRNFELSNLWQRSIFLSVFLVLCFSGYGFILVKIIESKAEIETLSLFNIVAIIIGIFSLLLSILWIMMAKGSKAWYEVYETAIYTIEGEEELAIKREEKPEFDEYRYRMGHLQMKKGGINHNIFSTKGGGYSVSKINVAIGQICFWLWCTVIIFHSLFNIINISYFLCVNGCCSTTLLISLIASFILPIVTILFASITLCSNWLKSEYLKNT